MRRVFLALIAVCSLPLAAHAQCAAGYNQVTNVFVCQPASPRTTIFTAANTIVETGWQGYSVRVVIPPSILLNPGFTIGKVRVSFTIGSTTSNGAIDAAFIGTGTATPDYDFTATPARLTFNGGANSISGLSGGQVVATDIVPFTFDFATATSMVVSLHFSGTQFDTGKTNFGIVGSHYAGIYYWLSQAVGTEASLAPSGTWGQSSPGFTTLVTKIEVTQ